MTDQQIAPLSTRLSNCATWHDEMAAKNARDPLAEKRHQEAADRLHLAAYRARQNGA